MYILASFQQKRRQTLNILSKYCKKPVCSCTSPGVRIFPALRLHIGSTSRKRFSVYLKESTSHLNTICFSKKGKVFSSTHEKNVKTELVKDRDGTEKLVTSICSSVNILNENREIYLDQTRNVFSLLKQSFSSF